MADGQTPAPPSSRLHRQSSSAALFIAVALGVSCVMAQLSLLREVLGAFSGNELVLGLTLGNWLLLMGIGARLGRTADRWKRPLPVLLVLQIVAAIVPLFQVLLLRGLR
ncbi:MAG TPA: hypothetical protein VFV81_06940, partial [Verrucomicrobiae bacterium]|nr:hypothetical protein [Verrucomicrobiae bacterium]